METSWFILVALMLVAYVVLDGFDLGAGIISPLVARNNSERQLVRRSIGPVWDGNEVWLLAAGGALSAGADVARRIAPEQPRLPGLCPKRRAAGLVPDAYRLPLQLHRAGVSGVRALRSFG